MCARSDLEGHCVHGQDLGKKEVSDLPVSQPQTFRVKDLAHGFFENMGGIGDPSAGLKSVIKRRDMPPRSVDSSQPRQNANG